MTNQGLCMNFLDLTSLAFSACIVLMIFVSNTEIEKSRQKVRVRVKSNYKK